MSPVIDVNELVHRYARRGPSAVDGLSFQVEAGEVYGLLGHNGAGKSTTIRCLLGLQRAHSGETRVLGMPSWANGVAIRRRCGYVPEEPRFYPWMTVRDTLDFVAAFHPTWDEALVADTLRRLDLDPRAKTGALSRGTSAKLALACATGFRPEALILDDPTSGLDALTRREFVEHVIGAAADEGRAVLFSSHVLDEVERLADRVGIVARGKLLLERRVDELKERFRRVTLTFAGDVPASFAAGRSVSRAVEGRTLVLVVDGWAPEQQAEAAAAATHVEVAPMSLEDIFVEVVRAARAAEAA